MPRIFVFSKYFYLLISYLTTMEKSYFPVCLYYIKNILYKVIYLFKAIKTKEFKIKIVKIVENDKLSKNIIK
jgi:hypothetical protein